MIKFLLYLLDVVLSDYGEYHELNYRQLYSADINRACTAERPLVYGPAKGVTLVCLFA